MCEFIAAWGGAELVHNGLTCAGIGLTGIRLAGFFRLYRRVRRCRRRGRFASLVLAEIMAQIALILMQVSFVAAQGVAIRSHGLHIGLELSLVGGQLGGVAAGAIGLQLLAIGGQVLAVVVQPGLLIVDLFPVMPHVSAVMADTVAFATGVVLSRSLAERSAALCASAIADGLALGVAGKLAVDSLLGACPVMIARVTGVIMSCGGLMAGGTSGVLISGMLAPISDAAMLWAVVHGVAGVGSAATRSKRVRGIGQHAARSG